MAGRQAGPSPHAVCHMPQPQVVNGSLSFVLLEYAQKCAHFICHNFSHCEAHNLSMGSSELEILHTHSNYTTTQCKQTSAHVKSPIDSLYYFLCTVYSLSPSLSSPHVSLSAFVYFCVTTNYQLYLGLLLISYGLPLSLSLSLPVDHVQQLCYVTNPHHSLCLYYIYSI